MNRAIGYKYDGINVADKIINGEKIKWEKGKCISFDTSIPHKFWNLTGRDRINLLVSLWK